MQRTMLRGIALSTNGLAILVVVAYPRSTNIYICNCGHSPDRRVT
jgi:hypothetical protein